MKGIEALTSAVRDARAFANDTAKRRLADMRGAEMRAPGALYHHGTDDDTDIGYSIDLRAVGREGTRDA